MFPIDHSWEHLKQKYNSEIDCKYITLIENKKKKNNLNTIFNGKVTSESYRSLTDFPVNSCLISCIFY